MSDEPLWTLERKDGLGAIELRVQGRLDADSGIAAAKRLVEIAEGKPFIFVADLTGLEGYDRETRQAFQSAFLEMPGQLKEVRFVGLGPVFRMAAATVCLAARIKADFHGDRASLEASFGPPPTRPPPPASQPMQ